MDQDSGDEASSIASLDTDDLYIVSEPSSIADATSYRCNASNGILDSEVLVLYEDGREIPSNELRWTADGVDLKDFGHLLQHYRIRGEERKESLDREEESEGEGGDDVVEKNLVDLELSDAEVKSGHFGVVVFMEDISSTFEVAVKICPLSSDNVKYSAREALPEMEMDCDNVVKIIKAWQEPLSSFTMGLLLKGRMVPQRRWEGALCIVMEKCDESLHDYLERGIKQQIQRPATETVGILLGLARGLSAFHDLRVMHRDIKPDNILLRHGVVKLADFGLTKPTLDDSDRTIRSHSQKVGTPGYQAPEQINSRHYSESSDVYVFGLVSLDLVLSELDVGQVKTAAVIDASLLARVWPSELFGLMEVVRHTLEFLPRNRPKMAEVVEGLVGLLNRIETIEVAGNRVIGCNIPTLFQEQAFTEDHLQVLFQSYDLPQPHKIERFKDQDFVWMEFDTPQLATAFFLRTLWRRVELPDVTMDFFPGCQVLWPVYYTCTNLFITRRRIQQRFDRQTVVQISPSPNGVGMMYFPRLEYARQALIFSEEVVDFTLSMDRELEENTEDEPANLLQRIIPPSPLFKMFSFGQVPRKEIESVFGQVDDLVSVDRLRYREVSGRLVATTKCTLVFQTERGVRRVKYLISKGLIHLRALEPTKDGHSYYQKPREQESKQSQSPQRRNQRRRHRRGGSRGRFYN